MKQKENFPDTPNEQLELAIEAVFKSWMGERAVVYREKKRHNKRHCKWNCSKCCHNGLWKHGR